MTDKKSPPKYCSNCGSKLDKEQYCPGCGRRIDAVLSHKIEKKHSRKKTPALSIHNPYTMRIGFGILLMGICFSIVYSGAKSLFSSGISAIGESSMPLATIAFISGMIGYLLVTVKGKKA